MIRVFPERKDQLDDQIDNFFLTITSHRLHKVFAFMPVCGEIADDLWAKPYEYAAEMKTPYYYKTSFENDSVSIEFSPQERSGFYKINFSGTGSHFLRLGILNGRGNIEMLNDSVVTGTEYFAGMKAFFYAVVDPPVAGLHYRDTAHTALLLSTGEKPRQVSFRYGISYISNAQAKENLEKEIPHRNFERVKDHARKTWSEALSKIKVHGGTEAQKRVFYTALYRTCERMVNINEYGRYFSAYDHQIHESNQPFYVDNWIWDTYIALEPLYMILDPEMEMQRLRSYVTMYEQSGTMPSFALVFGDWPAMTGNHAAAWMADAWFKDLKDFDLKKAYEGLRKNSLDATLIPWANGPRTVLDDFYNEKGYMPGLYPGEEETVKQVSMPWERRQSVSVTLENSYDDWCIAQLADELGYKEDHKLFLNRAAFYKNVYRADKGFMWPKDKEGKWIEPYDPRFADRMYFTENNAYTYNWYVKQDLQGLFDLMGGRTKARAKLDQLFREELGLPKWKFWYKQPDASGLVGQFVMGNENGLHIPYLYDYLGAPWRTQKRIRMLLDAFFTDNLFGMPGDEDGGAMSAFVVFSMMGFFPETPGIPVYVIGSPVFEKTVIELPGDKKFVVIAENASSANIYIQKAFLNGKPLKKPWFTHSDLMKGGELRFFMGDKPNKQWGTDPENIPPSSLLTKPSTVK
jgi:predicted alpha-1,2-mannosidase